MSGFAELVAATNYSFLRGASHPADMVGAALELGHGGHRHRRPQHAWPAWCGPGSRSTMRATEAQATLEELDFRLVVGARLVFADGRRTSSPIPRRAMAGDG